MKIVNDSAVIAKSVSPEVRSTEEVRIAWAAPLALSVALLLLTVVVKLDGRPHSDWQQFV